MDEILRLIDAFQHATCLWEDEVLLGFDDPGRAAREAEVTRLKEQLIMSILELAS